MTKLEASNILSLQTVGGEAKFRTHAHMQAHTLRTDDDEVLQTRPKTNRVPVCASDLIQETDSALNVSSQRLMQAIF